MGRSLAVSALLAAVLALPACATRSPEPPAEVACTADPRGELSFPLAPSGAPEAEPQWLWANRCGVRIVDVREAHELASGVIPGAEPIPLGELEASISVWDPNEPVVFVCRSGRRSTRAVELAEHHGFSRAASLTGGMLAWQRAELPTAQPEMEADIRSPASRGGTDASGSDLATALATTRIPRMRAASLLLEGFESCVDGREGHAVIGTPGGDLGELVLALSTAEALGGFELEADAIVSLFEAHIAGFGRVYLHTDAVALSELGARVREAPTGREALEAWLRNPPPESRGAVLDAVVSPQAIGCGHLRLVRSHPEAYDVRPAIVDTLIRAYFKTLWSQPEKVQFVVLDGEHHEGGVIIVEPEREIHAYSNVPAVPPIIGGRAYFVAHPSATTFIRRETVDFLLDEIPQLRARGVEREAFERALTVRGGQHTQQTLRRLGAGLPTYTLSFEDGSAVLHRDETP